jgi:hypothetical protein
MTLRSSALILLALAAPAFAETGVGRRGLPTLPPPVGVAEVFLRDDLTGLALSGFDPVSYFLPEGPKPGRAELEHVWAGVAWRFASEANRTAFAATPEVFAPRIGGYDATAASQGRLVDASAALHVVRGGRLYLFRSDANRARFLADESLSARSEERWPELQQQLVRP